MLLRHEVYHERVLRDVDLQDEAHFSRTFGHLRIPALLRDGKLDFSASQDLLVCDSAFVRSRSLLMFELEGTPPSHSDEN